MVMTGASNGSRGCIFETCSFATDGASTLAAFAEHRSRWPCSAAACRVLLGPKMHQLVSALLGSSVHVFNDQVTVPWASHANKPGYSSKCPPG